MDNLNFVRRFIIATKEGYVQWNETKGSVRLFTISEGFYTEKSHNVIIIMRQADDGYAMSIRDATGDELYRIDEANLLYDSDGDRLTAWDIDDQNALSRLFRLAERSAKKIDSLLDELTKDFPDENDVPFF